MGRLPATGTGRKSKFPHLIFEFVSQERSRWSTDNTFNSAPKLVLCRASVWNILLYHIIYCHITTVCKQIRYRMRLSRQYVNKYSTGSARLTSAGRGLAIQWKAMMSLHMEFKSWPQRWLVCLFPSSAAHRPDLPKHWYLQAPWYGILGFLFERLYGI